MSPRTSEWSIEIVVIAQMSASTRLVEADICAITTISMDHSEVLGDTLPKIATEKAGIHRPGVPLLCLDHEDEEVRAAIEGVAGEDVVWVPRVSEDAQEVARSMASVIGSRVGWKDMETDVVWPGRSLDRIHWSGAELILSCLLYTSPSPRDRTRSRMPSSA